MENHKKSLEQYISIDKNGLMRRMFLFRRPFFHGMVFSLIMGAGNLLTAQEAGEHHEGGGYIESAYGMNPTVIPNSHASGSLRETTPHSKYLPSRHPGISTPRPILNRKATARSGHAFDSVQFFAAQPLTYMPYLDGIYNFGNNAIQPGALISEDIISTGAQYAKTKLSRIGISYFSQTVIGYTGFSGAAAISGKRSYASDHSFIVGNWTFIRERSTGNGLFGTAGLKQGNGYDFNSDHENPRLNIGSATDPSGYYQPQNVTLSQLALGYTSCKGKLVVLGGMIDLPNYVDRNAYSQSASNQLVNKAFINTGALPAAVAGLGAHVAFQPSKSLYFLFASLSNNTPAKQNPFDHASFRNWTNVLEVGLVRDDVAGLGEGIYRFLPFYTTTDGDSGCGIAVNFQQQLGKKSSYGWFLRSAIADSEASTVTGIKCSAATGVVLHAPFGIWRNRNMKDLNNSYVGLGVMWSQASSQVPHTNSDEYGLELTYVLQVTPTMTIQPDIQVIHNPIRGKREGQTNVVFQIQNIWQF